MKVEGLIAAIRMGDKAAADALLEQFQPLLLRIAARYRGVSFEDALQEAYASFLHALRQYDASTGVPFAGFIRKNVHGAVRTAMRRHWRYRSRTVSADAPIAPDEDGTPDLWGTLAARCPQAEETVNAMFHRLWLDAAPLSPRERLAVQALLDGVPCGELAVHCGVGTETVKT
ncbi:MAG: sigma-70 family RNA polymerase sigma factor [Alicyclobacillus sp.]|nr:sigma-70 family RNA polymerase sigma factor [Alicyclobacillus sp.]